MQRQEGVWDRDVLLSALVNVLTEVTELSAPNPGDAVSDKVTQHWQLQIFVMPPSGRRKK